MGVSCTHYNPSITHISRLGNFLALGVTAGEVGRKSDKADFILRKEVVLCSMYEKTVRIQGHSSGNPCAVWDHRGEV